MKKNKPILGALFMLMGAACVYFALRTEKEMSGLLFGLCGAGLASGAGMLIRYFYWNAAPNRARYQERLENEKIEQNDELKSRLRDKAGRTAYLVGLWMLCALILLFTILDAVGAVENTRLLVICLGGCLIFQIAAGIVAFYRLLKKY